MCNKKSNKFRVRRSFNNKAVLQMAMNDNNQDDNPYDIYGHDYNEWHDVTINELLEMKKNDPELKITIEVEK